MNRNQILCSLVTGISFLIGTITLSAQEISEFPGAQLATQGLGRPYWHVFIAYAIAIGIVFFGLFLLAGASRRSRRRSATEEA